jgi:hypothetical protein
VDVVFNGHGHNYERNEVNGGTYVVTAGGGAPLYPMQEREPTQVAFALEYHFVLVEIDDHHLQLISSASTTSMRMCPSQRIHYRTFLWTR